MHVHASDKEIREFLESPGTPRGIWLLGKPKAGSGDGLVICSAFKKVSQGSLWWRHDAVEYDSLVSVETDVYSTLPEGYWALIWL